MENVKAIGREAKADAENITTIVQNAVKDSFENIKDHLSEYFESAKKIERNAEAKIKEHPVQSLLIAAGVGLVAGFLCSRK